MKDIEKLVLAFVKGESDIFAKINEIIDRVNLLSKHGQILHGDGRGVTLPELCVDGWPTELSIFHEKFADSLDDQTDSWRLVNPGMNVGKSFFKVVNDKLSEEEMKMLNEEFLLHRPVMFYPKQSEPVFGKSVLESFRFPDSDGDQFSEELIEKLKKSFEHTTPISFNRLDCFNSENEDGIESIVFFDKQDALKRRRKAESDKFQEGKSDEE